MLVVLQASCIGLTVNVWESLITLCDEVNLVWLFVDHLIGGTQLILPSSRPCSWTLKLVKGFFFFSRYVGLIVQSTNIILAQKIGLYQSVPVVVCRHWISYQIVVIFSFLSVINLVLNLRIYALHRRSRRICALLTVIFFSRLALATPFAIAYIPRLEFDEMCGFRVPKPIMIAFLFAEMVTQSFTLFLTFMARMASVNRTSAEKALLRMFYRDAVVTYTAIFSALVATLVYGRVKSFQGHMHFVFPIFVSILSVATCRLVINMQVFLDSIRSRSAQPFEFTSVFDVWESPEDGFSRSTP